MQPTIAVNFTAAELEMILDGLDALGADELFERIALVKDELESWQAKG